MPSHETTAWNVYAQQLLMEGHGYPLWDPRPTNRSPGAQIGDVGYIRNGGFIRLFNAMAAKDDPLNARYGVPENHEKFKKPDRALVSETNNAIMPGPICSKTIKQVGAKLEAQVWNVGASVTFQCVDDQGAVLVLNDPAHRQQLESRKMMNHLKQNHRDWYAFARDDVDLPCEKEDIVFVFGFVKTTRWAVASYVEGGKAAQFSFNGGYGSVNARINAFTIVGNARPPTYSWGPEDRLTRAPAMPSNSRTRRRAQASRQIEPEAGIAEPHPDWEADQCVFLRYYKMKWKFFWPTVIKAGAGYDELPRRPDDPSGGGRAGSYDDASVTDDGFVEQIPVQKTYDPTNNILDYILRASEATMAVATDFDIVRICKKHECDIPPDIPEFLDRIHPTVDVSEDGLGMLYFEDEAMHSESGPYVSEQQEEPANEPIAHEEQEIDPNPQDEEANVDQVDDGEPDPRKEGPTAVLDHQAGGITSLAYSNDGRLLASGSDDAVVEIWSVRNRQLLRTCEGHTQSISSLAFSPNGRELVSGSEDGLAIVWTTANGAKRFELADHTNDIYFVAYSPDGTIIATSSVDCTVRLWNARDGAPMSVLRGHNALVMAVVFSPDGQFLASASADFTACVWHVRTGQEVSKLQGHSGVVYSLEFSPDNRRIVTAAEDGTARIWNASTGEELVTLREHLGPVWAAVFSGDGRKVISGASDGTVKVCDSFGGELLLSLETGDMLVNAVAFSSDGSRVCASAEDNSIRVWSTTTGQQLTTLTGHEDKITHLKFSPDGKRIVSSSDDGMLRLWDLEQMLIQPETAF